SPVLATMAIAADFDNQARPFTATLDSEVAPRLAASANARFAIAVPVAANGNTLSATMILDGARDAGTGSQETYAFSWAAITCANAGNVLNGKGVKIGTAPQYLIGRQNAVPPKGTKETHFVHASDPVTVQVLDSNGLPLISGTALDISAAAVNNAYVSWNFSAGDMMNHIHLELLDTTGSIYLDLAFNPDIVGTNNAGSYVLA